MDNVIYINLHKSLTAAKTVRQSPKVDISLARYKGVQLLPNDPLPYFQVTDHPTGIELEDWTVLVYTLCGKLLGDITSSFFVVESFQDYNGIPQIRWRLKNVPLECGVGLVYMEITQTAGETFWSTPFQLTAYESECTTRFDYWNEYEETRFQSIQLQTWFEDPGLVHEINQYTEESTQYSRSNTVTLTDVDIMNTERLAISLMVKFIKMMSSDYVYKDLMRTYPYEAIETPRREGATNWNILEYTVSTIPEDVFDPNYEPPVPVPPEVEGDWSMTILGMKTRVFYENFTKYRAKVKLNHYPEFDTVLGNFCSMKVNGALVNFSPLNITVNDGVITMISDYTIAELTPNQVTISDIMVRSTNGFTSINYFYDGTPELFTETQINNKVERAITGTIEAV